MDVLLMLFVKSTGVLALAGLAAFALRNRSAAARHLVWLSGLSALLILPFGLLLPENAAISPVVFSSATVAAGLPRAAPPEIRWAAALWMAGVLVMLGRLVTSACKALRMIRDSYSLPCCGAFQIRVTAEPFGPLAWGFGRALVLLPECAGDWPNERRRAVVLHEAAHLDRKDGWALLIGELTCALYWCHPLVWYAAYRMRREQEHAADDYVLRQGIAASEYAGHLVAIASAGRTPLPLPGVVRKSDLAARVEAILDMRRRRSMLTRRMVLASAAAVLAIVLPVAAMQADRKVYKVGSGVTPPRVLYKEEPKYTQEASDAKIEGTVLLSVVIDVDGRAHEIEVKRSLEPGLDAAAIAALEKWIFRPGEKDGKPVAVSAMVEINFRLR